LVNSGGSGKTQGPSTSLGMTEVGGYPWGDFANS